MLDIISDGSILIIAINGEIDHHSAEEIKSVTEHNLKERNSKNIIFDFTNVTFMDSAGIGMLIGRYKTLSYIGGKICLCNPSGNIKKLINLSGINKIINIFDTKEAALNALKGGKSLWFSIMK